ncbi:MAG: ferredoxin [Geminicoccaceae bacterium]
MPAVGPPMLERLQQRLEGHGLSLRGGFRPEAADAVPPLADGRPAGTLLLVGHVGGGFWSHLQAAPERHGPDPIDRWSARVLAELAAETGAEPLFPFGGPPYHPFQRWALRADPALSVSPLGILIHPEHGLWHALRGALLLAEAVELPPPAEPQPGPCASCAGRPCLSACPVGAFSGTGFAVQACRACLGTLSGQACMIQGCLARNACPVGRERRYGSGEIQHHMRAFARGR